MTSIAQNLKGVEYLHNKARRFGYSENMAKNSFVVEQYRQLKVNFVTLLTRIQ